MRDPRRINELANALRGLWYKHPDLRLKQLLDFIQYQATGEVDDQFYVEDDQWLRWIEEANK